MSTSLPARDAMTPAERSEIDRRVPQVKGWPHDEHSFQRSLFSEMEYHAISDRRLELLFAIPNAAKRSAPVASRMKAEGMKSGVPDVFLAVAAGGKHGLWIELKKSDGRVDPKQWEWLLKLHRGGYAAHVSNDMNTARNLILNYLAGK